MDGSGYGLFGLASLVVFYPGSGWFMDGYGYGIAWVGLKPTCLSLSVCGFDLV
jgi:hypothetical protein